MDDSRYSDQKNGRREKLFELINDWRLDVFSFNIKILILTPSSILLFLKIN